MSDIQAKTLANDKGAVWEWANFIANHPPAHGEFLEVNDVFAFHHPTGRLLYPEIELFCDSEKCNGVRWFEIANGRQVDFWRTDCREIMLTYECKNCGETKKRYWFDISMPDSGGNVGRVRKNGEEAPFRPHIPRRLYRLFEEDKQLFENGRSNEGQGKGIGAFSYYRRIVENQKNRIIDEIIKVATKEGKTDIVKDLSKAKDKIEFSQAVDDISDHIPDSIRINGKNPLALLHRALSKGLHAKTDEECLKMAGIIRIVLCELAEKINEALKNKEELTAALEKLDD